MHNWGTERFPVTEKDMKDGITMERSEQYGRFNNVLSFSIYVFNFITCQKHMRILS